MKGLVQFAVTAALVAGATADLSHQHMHRHRQARKVQKRGGATTVWENPVATAYVYSDGEAVAAAEAAKCIKDGSCIVVGKSSPTFTPPVPSSTTKLAAEFFESKTSSSTTTSSTSSSSSTTSSTTSTSTTTTSSTTSSTTTSTTSSSTTSTTSSTTKTTSSTTAAAATSTAVTASGDFPSGKVKCSEFPSAYGAVAVDWVGLDGWASIQQTGSWTPGTLISSIVEPITGPCTSGSFCAYACAPGQTKSQWPTTSQGSTGQSIGGLWCNADGYLELTNPNFSSLCMDGLGGISIKNELDEQACVCGTNYPGNEMMNVPLVTESGGTYTLTNLNAKTAYQWQGKYTSGQFYVNNKGVSVDQACVWTSSKYPLSAGNWAPVNIGAGTDIHGVTYISIFPNTPTTTAQLDFDIEISGDITSPCYLKSGSYYGGSNGCTTALESGGSAVITFKESS